MPTSQSTRPYCQFSLKAALFLTAYIAATSAVLRLIPHWSIGLGSLSILLWTYGLTSFQPKVSEVAPAVTMFVGLIGFVVAAIALLWFLVLNTFSFPAFIG